MSLLSLFLTSWLLPFVASADVRGDWSAHREPGRSYTEYKSRAQLLRWPVPAPVDQPSVVTPMEAARPLSLADLPPATEWESKAVTEERFRRFRDLRFLISPSNKKFLRRMTWLYPDDGCYARAALAVRELKNWSVPVPKKVFAFGDLAVKSANAMGGEVTWWYHVAPLVEIRGQKYVLDPAIEPGRPLTLVDWLKRMSDRPETVELSVCESGTYTPGDDCTRPTDGAEAGAVADEEYFLDLEWQRILDLGRDPERELGDFPPW